MGARYHVDKLNPWGHVAGAAGGRRQRIRQWGGVRMVEAHQRAVVEGEEPGGLVQGGELAPPTELLREAWSGVQELGTGELPAGPAYTAPEDNPASM